MSEDVKPEVPAAPVVPDEPWAFPNWWKTRKFVGALVTSGICIGVAAATGHLSYEVGFSCLAPLLAWAGLHAPQVISPPTVSK